jgi:hypothetical protein
LYFSPALVGCKVQGKAAASDFMPALLPKGILSDLIKTKTAVKKKTIPSKPPSNVTLCLC